MPFLRSVKGTARTAAGLLVQAHRLLPALLRRDRDTIKALAAQVVFAGRPIVDVDDEGVVFSDELMESWIRPDTLARLRDHQVRGHDVVLVSASFGVYLRPLGERLGVTAVVGTELVVDQAGCCTGALDGGETVGVWRRSSVCMPGWPKIMVAAGRWNCGRTATRPVMSRCSTTPTTRPG